MKKGYLLLTLGGLMLALVGCTSQPTPANEEAQAQRLVLVSSGNPSSVLPAFTTYSWSSDYTSVLSSVGSNNKNEFKGYIREQIQAYLSTKGYQYTPNPEKAEVVFGFLFALEDAIGNKTIQQRFGLLPGLQRNNVHQPRYKKGSFVLAVLDNKQQNIYWRSAVQGFVDIEKDKTEAQSNRMKGILGMMLGKFPEAGR
jgi:hypothetical protein